MFRKLIFTCLLLLAAAFGTGTVSHAAPVATPVQATSELAVSLPAAPTAPALASSGTEATQLSTAQMSQTRGGLFGWLKKLWKKYKKKIIKIIWTIVKEIIESIINNETNEQTSAVSGTVTEYHEGTDTTTETYASQADYDASVVQSSASTDGGYVYQYSDLSYGSYSGGGRIGETYDQQEQFSAN